MERRTYQPTNKPSKEDVVSAETTARGAAKRPRKTWGEEKRDVLSAIANATKKHNCPPLADSSYKIIASLIGHLLNGGYDLALIRSVAVNTALEYDEIRRYSKLFQLRMRVRAAADLIELDRHTKQKLAEKSPFPLATLADVKRLDPRRRSLSTAAEQQSASVQSAERALYGRRG